MTKARRKHPKQFVRKKGKTKGKAISKTAREKYATIIEKKGGRTRYRFPIPPGDKAAARNALARIPLAKGLSSAQKKMVRDRAYQVLYGTTDKKKIAAIKGVKEK
jgi:hypothetical protein